MARSDADLVLVRREKGSETDSQREGERENSELEKARKSSGIDLVVASK